MIFGGGEENEQIKNPPRRVNDRCTHLPIPNPLADVLVGTGLSRLHRGNVLYAGVDDWCGAD